MNGYCELLVVSLELALKTIASCIVKNYWCVFWGQKVSRLSVASTRITPYLLNKTFLVKSVNQNLRNHHKKASDTFSWVLEQMVNQLAW